MDSITVIAPDIRPDIDIVQWCYGEKSLHLQQFKVLLKDSLLLIYSQDKCSCVLEELAS